MRCSYNTAALFPNTRYLLSVRYFHVSALRLSVFPLPPPLFTFVCVVCAHLPDSVQTLSTRDGVHDALLPATTLVPTREAEVDGILTGKSPLEKKLPLFPAKATHQQLLGLVHRPSHPDRPAPTVPRERKWLGNNVGWEGKGQQRTKY